MVVLGWPKKGSRDKEAFVLWDGFWDVSLCEEPPLLKGSSENIVVLGFRALLVYLARKE